MRNPFRRSPSGTAATAQLRASQPSRPDQPIEVGTVRWLRELSDALTHAADSQRPIFALFQEVPGCAGCQQFGAEVLSDPVLVDAIETEFVPLLIHNNTGGRDAEVLAQFGEPAWNFQVVRFLDAVGHDVIERRDRVWETGPVAARMIDALEATQRPVPGYLRLLEQQHSDRLRSVFIAQPCFWVGEAALGGIDGVVTTEVGFMERLEVTHLRFDPLATTLEEILATGADRQVASVAFADGTAEPAGGVPVHPISKFRRAPASDQFRQLQGRIPAGLNPAQLTKLNAAAVGRADISNHLSPRQLSELR